MVAQGGDPLLLEALDRPLAQPQPQGLADNLGSGQPERRGGTVYPLKRFFIQGYLYILHT